MTQSGMSPNNPNEMVSVPRWLLEAFDRDPSVPPQHFRDQLREILNKPKEPEKSRCCCPPKGYSGVWAAGPCPEHMGLRARSLQKDAQFEDRSHYWLP